MGESIKIGDMVDVYFEYVSAEFGLEILSTPRATGDCFALKRKDGTLINVQNYSKMIISKPL